MVVATPFKIQRIGYDMVKRCEPGQTGCPDCGGDRRHHGHGYGPWLFWPFKRRRLCKKCWGHGFIQFAPPPALPPSRSRTATRPEVVILSRHKVGIGDFAVIYVGGKEIAEIPILKAQSFEDGFYESLRLAIQEVVEGTCRT